MSRNYLRTRISNYNIRNKAKMNFQVGMKRNLLIINRKLVKKESKICYLNQKVIILNKLSIERC
jgi:hypothetical protein